MLGSLLNCDCDLMVALSIYGERILSDCGTGWIWVKTICVLYSRTQEQSIHKSIVDRRSIDKPLDFLLLSSLAVFLAQVVMKIMPQETDSPRVAGFVRWHDNLCVVTDLLNQFCCTVIFVYYTY